MVERASRYNLNLQVTWIAYRAIRPGLLELGCTTSMENYDEFLPHVNDSGGRSKSVVNNDNCEKVRGTRLEGRLNG